MLYLIDMKILTPINVVLGVVIILLSVLLHILNKHNRSKLYGATSGHFYNNFFLKMSCYFLVIVFSIVFVVSICQKLYFRSCYLNNNYSTVSGEVEEFEYVYAHNTNIIIGLKFTIDGEKFEINNGILNCGYKVTDDIISKNGQQFKISYIDSRDDLPVEVILRIDKHKTE